MESRSTTNLALPYEGRIQGIQRQQKDILANKKLSELPFEQQLKWCQLNGELGRLAYQAYQQCKSGNDVENAVRYFNMARLAGLKRARDELILAYEHDAKQDLGNKKLPEDPEALFTLAVANLLGIGRDPNRANAIILLEMAALKHNMIAQCILADVYYLGEGIAKDLVKAVEWCRRAAEQGYAPAQNGLAILYSNGYGVAKDLVKDVEWSRKAAEQGYAIAQNNLGINYEQGEGIAKDRVKAVEWYRRAAEQGYDAAQYNLARSYENGDGIEKDPVKAAQLYRQAAEQSHQKSINELKKEQTLPVMQYHAAMLDADAKKIKTLVLANPSLVDEIIWDINRSVANETLYQNISTIILPILTSKDSAWPAAMMSQLKIAYLIASHKHLMTLALEEKIDPVLFQTMTSLITNLSLEQMKQPDLITVVVDMWYLSCEVHAENERKKFTAIAAGFLKKVLFHLASLESSAPDPHFIHQCALIMIRDVYGPNYESGMMSPDMNQLMCFMTLIKMNPKMNVDEMNSILKMEFIKPVSAANNVNLLNRPSVLSKNSSLFAKHKKPGEDIGTVKNNSKHEP